MKVDIIGGGLSGLSAAISLKENDKKIQVTIHEKHKKIGYNHEGRRCGEAHTIEKEWSKWIPTKKSYYNMITGGDLIVGEKKYSYPRDPGTAFILNRQEFISQLGRKAVKLGVTILTGNKIKSVYDLDSDYIVDASGCPSIIKRELGFKKGIKGLTYQQTLEDSNCFTSDTIKVFYTGDYGYYWIFPRNPKKKEVNVGLGFSKDFNLNLKEHLEQFKEEQNIQGKINYTTGGLIPLGLQKPLKYRNILFVGDAGVGSFPFTGQGIYRALMSGDIAGICIAQKKADKYPYKIYQQFIKWDVIGKNYTYISYILREINPSLVLKMFNYFISFSKYLFLH